MSLVSQALRCRLEAYLAAPSRWCVALSGGLDSSVLLHGMCALRADGVGVSVRAIHVNHGLHSEADAWTRHCERLCRDLDVPLQIATVSVDPGHNGGPEAAARDARYAAFERSIGEDEYLLTAHHQDDQAETILLRLLRGAGARGLAGIATESRFGSGWLIRPLLELSREQLADAAREAGLAWIDDPTNDDLSFDRNYLRHAVLPLLRDRWPGMGRTISRAARLSTETAGLLDVLAEADCRNLQHDHALELVGLRRLESARQRNVIRYILKVHGLPAPSEAQLRTGLEQLLSARRDGRPTLRWGHVSLQRYRDRLYFLDFDPDLATVSLPDQYAWDGTGAIDMGPIRGRMRLIKERAGGIALPSAAAGIRVRFRHGGERIRRVNQKQHKSLKKLFQERGIVPWMRCHVPLLYSRDEGHADGHGDGPDHLLAVGDLWIAADAMARPGEAGYRIVWENHANTL